LSCYIIQRGKEGKNTRVKRQAAKLPLRGGASPEIYWEKFEDVSSLKVLFFPMGKKCFEDGTFDLEQN